MTGLLRPVAANVTARVDYLALMDGETFMEVLGALDVLQSEVAVARRLLLTLAPEELTEYLTQNKNFELALLIEARNTAPLCSGLPLDVHSA